MFRENKVFDRYISVTTKCRPVRVAYLIEENDEANINLDYIFSEAYSRWGGRYTLIIPLKGGEILSEEFWAWLKNFDPDYYIHIFGYRY